MRAGGIGPDNYNRNPLAVIRANANHRERGLPFTIVRPLNFFGPRMDYMPDRDGGRSAARFGVLYDCAD